MFSNLSIRSFLYVKTNDLKIFIRIIKLMFLIDPDINSKKWSIYHNKLEAFIEKVYTRVQEKTDYVFNVIYEEYSNA